MSRAGLTILRASQHRTASFTYKSLAASRATYTMVAGASTKDWDARQYLRYNDQRMRPAWEMLQRVPQETPKRVVDLGCGPGNSTELLVARYPNAQVSGMDSSQDMIEKAKAALPNVPFTVEGLEDYEPKEPVDVYFCNAVFQWVPQEKRIPIIVKLLQSQPSGGAFAFAVPDNMDESSHEDMRTVAAREPWSSALKGRQPARDNFQTPQQLYDGLIPHCSSVDIWHTVYQHQMDSHQAIVEWVKGTGLRPFIDPLSDELRASYLKEYHELLTQHYPVSADGKVLFRFPRLFVVAIRK